MVRQYKVVGTDIKTGEPFDSGWCDMEVEKIEIGDKVLKIIVDLDYIEMFSHVAGQMLKDWQFEYRDLEVQYGKIKYVKARYYQCFQ